MPLGPSLKKCQRLKLLTRCYMRVIHSSGTLARYGKADLTLQEGDTIRFVRSIHCVEV